MGVSLRYPCMVGVSLRGACPCLQGVWVTTIPSPSSRAIHPLPYLSNPGTLPGVNCNLPSSSSALVPWPSIPIAPLTLSYHHSHIVNARGPKQRVILISHPSQMTRVRSGCATCRKRHLKCDGRCPNSLQQRAPSSYDIMWVLESRPRCRRCIRSSRPCDYSVTLVWPNAPLSLATCPSQSTVPLASKFSSPSITVLRPGHRRGIESLPPSSQQVCQGFLHFTTRTMDLYYRHMSTPSSKTDTTEDEDSEMITTQPSRSGYQRVNPKESLQNGSDTGNHSEPGTLRLYSCPRSDTEGLLLNFYVNKIQQDKVYFLLDQGQNPVTFMLMAADTSPALYTGILLYAADRLAQLDPRFSHVVMRYRHRTLVALRDLLIQRERSTRDILLVSMMLCIVEVSYRYPVV